jgi:hypothetical protein
VSLCLAASSSLDLEAIFKKQQKISQIIRETLDDETLEHHPNPPPPPDPPAGESSIHPFCPTEKQYESLSACCSSQNLFNLENVKVSNQTFIGFSSQPKDTVSLPVIRSLMIDRHDYQASISFLSQSFNESCLEYFEGTLHVIGSITAHKLYHAGTDRLALTIPHTLSVSLCISSHCFILDSSRR